MQIARPCPRPQMPEYMKQHHATMPTTNARENIARESDSLCEQRKKEGYVKDDAAPKSSKEKRNMQIACRLVSRKLEVREREGLSMNRGSILRHKRQPRVNHAFQGTGIPERIL